MIEPRTPTDEAARQRSLQALAVLDTGPEERFDRLTRLASRTFDVPVALVSLIDGERQWFKSCQGLDVTETPRAISFCGHAILEPRPLVVADALTDPRFADNPLVTGAPHIRFYAGAVVQSPDGHAMGTLCLIDTRPRDFSEADTQLLLDLAEMVTRELAGVALAEALQARERAEAEVASSQRFWQATLDALQEHVAIVDASGVVVAVNASWRRYADENGFRMADHGIGMNYLAVAEHAAPHSPEAAAVAEGLRELLAGRGEAITVEYPCFGPDGPRWFVASLSRFAGDGPVHVVVSHTDITARKRAEQALARSEGQLQRQVEKLKQMDALKDEFLGSVSHELKAPLHAIMGFANILANEVDGPLGDRQRADLNDLLASADDLSHLIDDLLALSQLRAGRFSLNLRPTNLSAVAASVIAGMASLAAMGDRTLVLDAPEALMVVTDELRVAQVLRNMLHNALKFTHPHGRVTLRLRVEGEGVRCEVEDDGIGIDSGDFGLLFERFSQLEAGKQRGGTGLGLSICKGLVEAQGGTIGLVSELGRGTTFWFALPIDGAAPRLSGPRS